MDLSAAARTRAPRRSLPLLLSLLTIAAHPLPAQTFAPAAARYDPAVPTVADLRGFATGAGFSTYRDLERVLEGLDRASERIRLETYGVSAEGRPLRVAWVSSPANLARLEELRSRNRAPFEGAGELDPEAPVFVWLSFGVHGDEASSPEAALELLYHLAAATDAETAEWLERSVLAIDPLLNPDGHERYVAWYRSAAGAAPDPDPGAREHRPPWPGGRTNHWHFDLNRDWAWEVQPETRARRAAYLATLPQVHVDFHEMDAESSYFFFPPAPVHTYYPESTARWGRVFGEANAAAFDARGWPYYTEEDFDLFYPGYGDSWPSFFGATGMTYEQAGGGRAGVSILRQDGGRLTLAERTEHHFVAALTTIATAVEHRAERLADFAAFWRAGARAAPGAPAAYLLPRGAGADSLAALLQRQGIEVDTLTAGIGAVGLQPYEIAPARDSLPAGTFVLRGDQPLGRYLAALMATDAALPDTSLFYDITGWTLPYLYDAHAYRASAPLAAPAGRWRPAERAGSAPELPADAVAVAWAYESSADALAAARLAAAGWRVRVATRPFRAAGRAWRPGSFVLVLARQPDSLRPRAAEALGALSAATAPVALRSFRTEDGIDLGSDRFRTLRAPRIALAAGPPADPTSLGAAWHLLDERFGLPVDVVWAEDLAAREGMGGDSLAGRGRRPLALEGYTAIVLPDGPGADAWAAALGAEGAERLEAWVEAGGTLIGIRAGAAWLSEGESGISGLELAESPEPDDAERRRPEAVREADEVRRRIPGTLLAAVVDTTAALGYGYPGGEVAVLVRDPTEIRLGAGGNAWIYADRAPLSGYLPNAARERLAGTPYAVVEKKGRGAVVLLADDPAFRGIVRGLERLYLNAVLLVPGS